MKNNLIFIFLAVVILAGLFYLSSGEKAPFIPADTKHQTITTEAACLECHAPGKQAPLKPSHPPKEQCLVCHKTKNASSRQVRA